MMQRCSSHVHATLLAAVVRGRVWLYSLNTDELCGIKMHLTAWIPLPTRGGSLTYRRFEMSDTHETRLLMNPTTVASTSLIVAKIPRIIHNLCYVYLIY